MAKRPKIIVVGGGVAGCMAALSSIYRDAEVSLVTLCPPRRSASVSIREGFNATTGVSGEDDCPENHARDTILCGDFLAHQGTVRAMCDAAPTILNIFDRMGAVFGRTSEGRIGFYRSSGSSSPRTALGIGGTGHQLICALDSQLRRHASAGKIRLYEGWEFLSLIIDEGGRCLGVAAVNLNNMEVKTFAADVVVVCTGGFAGLWGKWSASPGTDGSAIARCFEQGACFANPEFVELHPFAVPFSNKCVVIGSAILSAGACATASRDPASGHFLDISGVDPHWLDIYLGDTLSLLGRIEELGSVKDQIRLEPAVFRTLGGLWVDRNHAATIPGLFAAGGACCQYHGACALGGNELLASAHGGQVAGKAAAEYALSLTAPSDDVGQSLFESARVQEEDRIVQLMQREGEENVHLLRRELSEAVRAAAGAQKDNVELSTAREKISELRARSAHATLADRSHWENGEVVSMRRFSLSFNLAELVVAASIARDESRGSHFKPKFPNRNDDKWLVTTKATWMPDGPKFDYSEKIEILDFKPVDK